MSISEDIIKISPLETLKDKYQWKPVFIKFGDRHEDIENYFSAYKASEFSLALLYCAVKQYNKDQLIDFISIFFFSTKYIDFLEKLLTHDINEIYIGGIKYTDTWFLKQKGWIEEKRA